MLEAEGFPDGMCTLDCDRLCPDRPHEPVTFCIGVDGAAAGSCVSKCDDDIFLGDGCRDGYDCVVASRFMEPSTRSGVCLPEDDGGDDPPPPAEGACFDEAHRRGLQVRPANERRHSPDGRPDIECRQPEALHLSSPVNGADWRYYTHDTAQDTFMACRLALALDAFGDLLAEHEIVEVEHLGVYNCRLIGDTDQPSEHGHARAIDPSAFVFADGSRCFVEHDWEGLHDEAQTLCGQMLQDIAWDLHTRRIFNVVLTPDYNAAHYNHFHVDLTPGSHFLG